MSQITLGERPIGTERDAIHVAVIPVIAGEKLAPARRVSIRNGEAFADSSRPIGIVDPYLTEDVTKGTKFYLCLMPNTVQGMRHHWHHSAFPTDNGETDDRAYHERWLREYAKNMNPYDSPQDAFDRLIEGLKDKHMFAYGTDLHGLYELDDSADLRRHAEAYLGIEIDWSGFEFSCSC